MSKLSLIEPNFSGRRREKETVHSVVGTVADADICYSVKFWFGDSVCILSGTLPYTLQKLLDRFDYDDEPEAVEDAKKEDATVTAVASAATAAAPSTPAVATPAIAAAVPVPSTTSPPPPQVPL